MITELVTLFVFVFILLMVNLPQLQENDMMLYKLYIFVGIFIFSSLYNMTITLYQKQIVNFRKILQNSLQIGLLSVVGYAIFCDMEGVYGHISSSVISNMKASIIILAFIAIGHIFNWLISTKNAEINDCLNLLYQTKNAK